MSTIISRMYKVSATTVPTQVCAANPNRDSISLKADSGHTVIITPAQNTPIADGYPVSDILPHESDSTQGELWVQVVNTNAVLYVWENSVEE
jgi:hypothetical protein